MANNGQWLVFVDTNIFLDFYRLGGESAERQLAALERHKAIIITGDQVRMEFLKNRQKVIVESMKLMKKPEHISVPPIVADYTPAKQLVRRVKATDESLKKVKEKVDAILREPARYDPVYQSVQRIFNFKSRYNLTRPDKVRFEVRSLARKRFMLGYPPRKSGDTSIGDAINWEWIVMCARKSAENHHVLIVSRDGDFGVNHQNEAILNDWLQREFKDRVSRKRKVELTNKLTVALRKLDELVEPEDEKEEQKVLDSWKPRFRFAEGNKIDYDRLKEVLAGYIANQENDGE